METKELQLVVFRMGKEEYGVDVSQVREIIKMENITRIPNSSDCIEGVINLRGQVTPVINLGKKLSLDSCQCTRVIILELNSATLGIMVDAVNEVARLPSSCIESIPSLIGGTNSEHVKGVGKMNDRLLILLDIKSLLKEDIGKLC